MFGVSVSNGRFVPSHWTAHDEVYLSPTFVVDRALSRRLENAEARANIAFVEARARIDPTRGAAWCEVADAYARFDGIDSPCTQTFGLGMSAPPTPETLERLETFFHDRGAPVFHEVSPLADSEVLRILPNRGYHPIELTTIMYQPLDSTATLPTAAHRTEITVRRITADDRTAWAETAAAGWGSVSPDLSAFVLAFGQVSVRSAGTSCFLAELGGTPIAAAAISVHGNVAILAGASTRPEWRGRGAQGALLRARLTYAADVGCDLAMMGAHPGSASQRNAERAGFWIAYTRIKWRQAPGRP